MPALRSGTIFTDLGQHPVKLLFQPQSWFQAVTAFNMTTLRKLGKIVIVSQHYAPDPSTTASYLTAIAEGLLADYEVLVISGTAHSASPRVSEKTEPHVVEVKTWTPKKTALARRAIAMILFSAKIFFVTLKHVRKGDLVFC